MLQRTLRLVEKAQISYSYQHVRQDKSSWFDPKITAFCDDVAHTASSELCPQPMFLANIKTW